ncbi:MAG: amidohydrolase family protein [Sphingomonadales bacterium]
MGIFTRPGNLLAVGIIGLAIIGLTALAGSPAALAQEAQKSVRPAPDRAEGEGPFERLVIRGGILIDGTGAPPFGPVDIVIENNIITEVKVVSSPHVAIDPAGRPAKGDFEVDAQGMYILPGFINAHAHISNPGQFKFGEAAPAEYAYKLWLAHGVTTIREVGAGNGRQWTLNQKERSAANLITAPRVVVHDRLRPPMTPDEARKWVRQLARDGADGIKFGGAPPEVMAAALDEAGKRGLRTAMHHAQLAVTRWNVLDSARAGLTSMEHWYGLPEAMFENRVIQDYPVDYNYNDEQHRFGQAGRLWAQAAKPGSKKWNEVMDELIALDFTIVPTMTIYEAARDVMAARTTEWLADYTWPTLWRFFQPSRVAHGSFWFDWTTADEIAWRKNYQLWMAFLNEFKNRGGRIALGDDAGFIYKLYGFGYIREFELLQEAGFHPLEVVRSATLLGAELVGREAEIGTVEKGKLADLVIVAENPLANFKVLYGTGAVRLNDATDQVERVGGIRWTVKDGIVFDAKALLADVKKMVVDQKQLEAAEGGS